MSVQFLCTFEKKGSKFKWYKDKLEIFHGFKNHIETDGANYKLTVNKINVDDEGRYTCKVNDIETSANLKVDRK